MQPKPLSAEEACRVWFLGDKFSSTMVEHMASVLAECRKRDLALIEALPSYVQQMDCTGAWVLIPRPNDIDTRERHVRLSDIKSALLDGRSA